MRRTHWGHSCCTHSSVSSRVAAPRQPPLAIPHSHIRGRPHLPYSTPPPVGFATLEGEWRDGLIELSQSHRHWAIGFQDETWWSRVAQPELYAWCDEADPVRLIAQSLAKDDPDPKALACYGLLLKDCGTHHTQMLLRFVSGQPVSEATIEFLSWSREQLTAQGKKVLLMVWDNASWHIRHGVRSWLREHSRSEKATQTGVRIVSCLLPIKSPWLNRMEAHWIQAKRSAAEPDRPLAYQ